jgi:photosystem II stability/assembly factor-like uncharacterized protein
MKLRLVPLLLLPFILLGCTTNPSTPQSLTSLNSHVHGLAVDRADSSRVYIATHNGLFLLSNNKDLTLVGKAKNDYMGFSPHPTDSKVIFSSGHPSTGGNLGVQKSTDAGVTWKKLTNGDPSGPVDFHAMAVSEANPSIIFGWYRGYVYRSEDNGETWKTLPNQVLLSSFGTDSKDEKIVYAGTKGGLLKSFNKGETWEVAFTLQNKQDVVFDIEVDPKEETFWLTTAQQGVLRGKRDPQGALTFETVGTLPNGAIALQLAVDRKNSQNMYAASEGSIYKSIDAGKRWYKIL